jgi:hypothetical protein
MVVLTRETPPPAAARREQAAPAPFDAVSRSRARPAQPHPAAPASEERDERARELRGAPPAAVEPSVASARRAPDLPASDLAAETALLGAAQSALGRGDARAALQALDAHERQFPSGALTEERLGARVFALCGLGRRADAASAARALLDRAPSSPLRARVEGSCVREP